MTEQQGGDAREGNWRTQELLARLDERMTVVVDDLKDLRRTVVTQAEFKPVRLVAYGLIGLLTTGVVTAMLSLVLQK